MITATRVNRLALLVGLVLAGAIVWLGFRDGEPLLILLGPALLGVAALIRVDSGFSEPPPAPLRSLGPLPEPSSEVERLLLAGNKIGAIKQYRQETDSGLKEAKDAVEAIELRMRMPEA